MHIAKYDFSFKRVPKINQETENICPSCVQIVKVLRGIPNVPNYK